MFDFEMKDFIEKTTTSIEEDFGRKKDRLLFDTIIDIYNLKYRDYKEYVEEQNKIIDNIHKAQKESFENRKYTYSFSVFVYPIILDKKQFSYILEKGVKDKLDRRFKK